MSSLTTPVLFDARVPLAMEVPEPMRSAVAEVLAGEYESGYFGENLRILDVGANVGSFSLWAHLRWPGSEIHAYEPHPGTFALLERNLAHRPNIHLHNCAIYPTDQRKLPFFTRYDGDGESGLAACMEGTFAEAPGTLEVDVQHPATLPAADVVKLDVEGAEADILRYAPLHEVSLVLLEYQNDQTRAAIKSLLSADFRLEFEDEMAWDDLLDEPGYRPDLAGNHWGRMFFIRKNRPRLRKLGPPRPIVAAPLQTAPMALTAPTGGWERLRRLFGRGKTE